MMGNQPVVILKEGTTRERGRTAQANNIQAAKEIADAVRSTLGPKGMDKMLVDQMGDVVITNDGATILKKIDVQHPAAKMVIEVSKTLDREIGDGTTSAVVLAGALLSRAEALIEDVHPTLINRGYRLAADKAVETLKGLAQKVGASDEKTLLRIARTAMPSKLSGGDVEPLAQLAVRAVRAVAEERNGAWNASLDNVTIVKKTGASAAETELIEGVIVDKERVHTGMPKRVESPRIALLEAALEIEKPEITAKIQIRDPAKMQAFLAEEESILREKVESVRKSGANVVVCQKGIDDLAQHFLAKAGIYAVRRAKKSDLEQLARATGARIVSDVKDLTAADLGKAGLVEERRIGSDDLTFVSGAKGARSVAILVRGSTEHVTGEIERVLQDALGVLRTVLAHPEAVPGAGAPEVAVALALRRYAATVGGREQLAIEAYADAVEAIPRAVAENAGLNGMDAVVELRHAHEGGKRRAGVDVATGKAIDAWEAGIVEPLAVKVQALQAATDVAALILRIDDVIASKAPGSAGAPGKM